MAMVPVTRTRTRTKRLDIRRSKRREEEAGEGKKRENNEDSMKQKMGLEIYFVLMWQEDSSRVNWALQNEMQNGSAFSFSPAILE